MRTARGTCFGLAFALLVACNGGTTTGDGSAPPISDKGTGEGVGADGAAADAAAKDAAAYDLANADAPPATFPPGDWISVPAGTFLMGSPSNEYCRDDDETQHSVTVTGSFEMAKTEVTQAQFTAVMGYNPAYHATCGPTCPVEWVSWHEAAVYCNRLSEAKGLTRCYSCTGKAPASDCDMAPAYQGAGKLHACPGYRLPTEAEFEHALRAGTTTPFYSGAITSCMGTSSNAGKIGWYKVDSGGSVHPVAGKTANTFGLHDLSGNVYEWVNDWYQADLGSAPAKDPTGPASGTHRVFRGGAWYYNAEHMRSANRLSFFPGKRFTFLGFRCVRSL
jgi:formylglycine-generating enzyme required for sulfatase activity